MFERFGVISTVLVKSCPLLFIFAAVSLTHTACDDPHTAINVAMDKNIPPTFSFSGPWWAIDFEVIELSEEEPNPENNYSTNDKTIWKISLPKGQRVKTWPSVTFGVIPEGFSQRVPADGRPPELVGGKTYAAQAIDSSRSGGAIYFVIRNGKPVSAPEAKFLKESPP